MLKIHLRRFRIFYLRGEIAKFRKIRIFKHNSALNYSTMKKFHMRGLDLNTQKKKKMSILEFLKLIGNIAKFRKIRIFERNSALNYPCVRKFHMSTVMWTLKNYFRQFWKHQFKGATLLNFENFDF